MLLGAELHVFTDHKNLTHKMSSFTMQCIMRWCLLLKKYTPKFHYKTSETNFIANALSHVPTSCMERESQDHAFNPFMDSQALARYNLDPNDLDAFYIMVIDNKELADCLLEYPAFDEWGRHPFHFETIQYYQQCSEAVKELVQRDPGQFIL